LRNPKFSVLLIVKNALALVTGALNSLKHQTFKDFEVVVVDGASTDGTLGLLHEAAKELPLRIVSEADRSLAEGFAKALRRATGEIVGMLCADERYYPNTLEQVLKWFEAEPNAVTWCGKVDFIDEHDKVIGSHFTAPFNLPAHLACELVPSNLSSFFNRQLIGEDFRFEADVPTCPDYEYWARLGFRFPEQAFRRYDVSVAQAYRTRDSMSFRAESFTQFCRDKLTHLNRLLAVGYGGSGREALRPRASAGIHMWAAEQLAGLEPGRPDILAHCAAAARHDKSYERIAHFMSHVDGARYDAATGTVRRDCLGPRTTVSAQFECSGSPAYWQGATILARDPLTLRTASDAWGFSVELSLAKDKAVGPWLNGGQYWARIDLEVVEGSVGISQIRPNQALLAEKIFGPAAERTIALIPLSPEAEASAVLMVRSGGQASSVVRIHRAELICDPDLGTGIVPPINICV
jgi:hypothetical protein